ncbi:MAG: hypothetical protein U0U33_13540 [Chitinophagaceae bacterium]|nr:hypothetical protein [Panacibacter sp.]
MAATVSFAFLSAAAVDGLTSNMSNNFVHAAPLPATLPESADYFNQP